MIVDLAGAGMVLRIPGGTGGGPDAGSEARTPCTPAPTHPLCRAVWPYESSGGSVASNALRIVTTSEGISNRSACTPPS